MTFFLIRWKIEYYKLSAWMLLWGIQRGGAAALVGEKPEVVPKHLEPEINFEEVTISWSHGYAGEEILGERFSVKKGTEVGGQRISLGLETGLV